MSQADTENKVLRILYVVIFYIIYSFTDLVLLVVTVLQTFLNLFTHEPSQSLKEFGARLAVYLRQIARYLSYVDDFKPFPFNDWPELDVSENHDQEKLEADQASGSKGNPEKP